MLCAMTAQLATTAGREGTRAAESGIRCQLIGAMVFDHATGRGIGCRTAPSLDNRH
jgi:hypothetical protein